MCLCERLIYLAVKHKLETMLNVSSVRRLYIPAVIFTIHLQIYFPLKCRWVCRITTGNTVLLLILYCSPTTVVPTRGNDSVRCFCGLTGRSERQKKAAQCIGSQYQEGMMRVMCWCLCSAVKDVLEVLEMPARNPFEVCRVASSSLKALERG